MKPGSRIAVLGAGIMGCCTALFLARRGFRVSLIDRESAPVRGASRWNEGKIHLGYLYAVDRTLETARRVLLGGLAFRPLLEELLECSMQSHVTPSDDLYLVHPKSVVDSEEIRRYFAAVDTLVTSQPDARDYLADASRASTAALSSAELEALSGGTPFHAGFRVPERSIQTTWLADRLIDRVEMDPLIEFHSTVRVTTVQPPRPAGGLWTVTGEPAWKERFGCVVNALWHGRLTIDQSAGLKPKGVWTHRYRVSLFVRTSRVLDIPSAVVAVGPFGDVKNYNGRDFYVSWYPAGLIAESRAAPPPTVPRLTADDKLRIQQRTYSELGAILPNARAILDHAETVDVEGGHVFAQGTGSLADRHATLHRRDRFGVQRIGGYISVDTGKYSTAPWLARQVASEIAEGKF